jgi:HD-GYP domain-containing protein (c-di-GMP phosphodiesterase class II)
VFSIHGLMTPGHIAERFHTSLAVSVWVSVMAGGVFVALSVLALPAAVERIVNRLGIVVFAWVAVAIGAYMAMSFAYRDWLDFLPTDNRRVQYVLAAASFSMYAFAAYRYAQAYLFARLTSQAAMVAAQVLLCQVPPIILFGTVWHASWWIYHALYLAALVVLFAGWAIESRRAGSIRVIADGLSMRDALAQLDRGHDAHLLELVDAVEAKDRATLGHVRRVGAYALDIGRHLGLGAQELRSLALAAEMHDVGKIGVPDAILLKPGPLDEAEFAEMQRHTARGGDIAGRVERLRPLAAVIRAHHERFNGRGYPDGLAGEEIPLLSRIISVADSYDAMTSARPYRGAMTHEQAIAELKRVSGTELDPRCVAAFLALYEDRAAAA